MLGRRGTRPREAPSPPSLPGLHPKVTHGGGEGRGGKGGAVGVHVGLHDVKLLHNKNLILPSRSPESMLRR